MKLGAQQPRLAPVIPGPLLALIVYAVLVRVLSIYGLVTLSFPKVEGLPVDRAPATVLVVIMSVIHLGFAVVLVGLYRKSRSAPAGVRRAHLAGCMLGAVLIVLLQWGALSGLGVMNSMLDNAGR